MTPWRDQFVVPHPDHLVEAIPADRLEPFRKLLAALEPLDGLAQEVRWMGIPWRWTLAFREPDEGDLAFLVPDPERPRFAMPIPVGWIDGVDPRTLARPVREGLARARVVGQVAWAEWDLDAATLASDLALLVSERLGSLADA